MDEFIFEYDFIIVEDPHIMASKPQSGATSVMAGKMNKKGIPKVCKFLIGAKMCTRYTIVKSMSSENDNAYNANHF